MSTYNLFKSEEAIKFEQRNIKLNARVCDLMGLSTKRLPLKGHCIYSGADFNEGARAIAVLAGNRSLEQVRGGEDRFLHLNRVKLHFSQLSTIFHDVPARLKITAPLKHFTFFLPLSGYHKITLPSGEYVVKPGQAGLILAGQKPQVYRSENSVVLVANLCVEGFQKLFGCSVDKLIDSGHRSIPSVYNVLDQDYGILLSILGTLLKALDGGKKAQLDLVIEHLEPALWNQFDDLVPRKNTEDYIKCDLRKLPQKIRKAVKFIHENADSDISLSALEKVTGISSRSLQLGFKNNIGITPMSYVKKLRLAKVRADLLIADVNYPCIGDIAAHWGFFHLSNFAKDYRNEFGELPSETMKYVK